MKNLSTLLLVIVTACSIIDPGDALRDKLNPLYPGGGDNP